MSEQLGMTSSEKRAVAVLASLFSLRMLGLFMILPVFALYEKQLQGVTPFLAGLAVGIYALSQALLQIPLSQLSDRVGRKRLIIIGMLMFAVGGAIAAMSETIWGVIIGRALQGAGAISGVVMALLGDLTRVEQRTKAMAMMGMSIGLSFALAFVLGPLFSSFGGLSGLFWCTCVMGLAAVAVTIFWVPEPVTVLPQKPEGYWDQLLSIFRNPELLRLNWGIFVLHLVMAAFFMAIPLLLTNNAHLPVKQHGYIYLPILLGSFLVAVPAMIFAEKKQRSKEVFVIGIICLMAAFASLAFWHESYSSLIVGLILFFVAFNTLEATLPSLVSKIAAIESKGTAMGVYATSQFLGAFLGSPLGSVLSDHVHIRDLFILLGCLTLSWLLFAITMAKPKPFHSVIVRFPSLDAAKITAYSLPLNGIAGVHEVVFVPIENIAYLKVDPVIFQASSVAIIPEAECIG
jgi:predicted MFS family arabinose efflux permease